MSRAKIIMIFGCLTVIVISVLFGFTSFLDYFSPSDDIGIAILESDHWQIVAVGKSTLWYQWQIWIYIGLFCIVVAILCGLSYGIIQIKIEQQLSETKQKLDEKIAEYKRSQAEFEKEKTLQIKQGFAHERHSIEIMTQDALNADEHARAALSKAEHINKTTNHSNKAQNRKNRSKLAQRDRLSEQKRMMSEFLLQSGWTFQDGTPITYSAILDLSRKLDIARNG